MLGHKKSSLLMALLVGLAVGAIATQLEPTDLSYKKAVSEDKPEWRVVMDENTRRVRPTPAALANAITSAGSSFASSSQSLTPREPIHNSATSSGFSNAEANLSLSDQEEPSAWVRVNGSVVNVRSGPSASARRIGSFPQGTRLRVIERGGSWTKIEDPETGQSGWMYRDYLAGRSEGSGPAS